MKRKHQYLIYIQYLGFRFHGWAKQPNHKTIQGEIEKNIRYLVGHAEFMTLGASRTDAMVSAEENAFSLFIDDELDESFIEKLNLALPNDIKTTTIRKVALSFNIINHAKSKTYRYKFTTSDCFHPFESSNIAYIKEELDIEQMERGANLFEGTHDFRNFCFKPKEKTTFTRQISSCTLLQTKKKYYILEVKGNGFLRHQIRIIMGTLLDLGQNKISLSDIEKALKDSSTEQQIGFTALASGLTLQCLMFDHPTDHNA